MVPLLQGPEVNPYATLITLFMNAVPETMHNEGLTPDFLESMKDIVDMAVKYFGMTIALKSPNDPIVTKLMFAKDLVKSHDRTFDR